MAWSISHGGSANSTLSGTQISNLGDKLKRAANPNPWDWSTLAPLFAPRSGDPFKIEPAEAERIGNALHRTADSLRFWDRGWAAMARQIADSALRASRAFEPWRWS